MSILTDVIGQYSPSTTDLSGAKSGLTLALSYPGGAQYLVDNPSALNTALTLGNITSTPNPLNPKDPTGLYIIFGILVFVGIAIGWFLGRK